MAIYNQYKIGNFKLYVFDSKAHNDHWNIDKYVLLRGSDISWAIRNYVQYFIDKYRDEIYNYNSYTEEPKFINNFLYDSDDVKAEISENEINADFQDVIIDEGTNSKLWVYNGNNVKLVGWAKRNLGRNGSLLLRNFTLYVYVYYKDGDVYKCFGVPYQVLIGGYYNPDTPEEWTRQLDSLYTFDNDNWSYFAALGSVYYADDPKKLELSFAYQNANPGVDARPFWGGFGRLQQGWLVLTYNRILSQPIQSNIQSFKLNADNTIPPGIDVTLDLADSDQESEPEPEDVETQLIEPNSVPADFTSNGLNMYSINDVTLERVNRELWQSDPNFWDSIKGTVQNASECIVSLHAIPCRATYTDIIPINSFINLGNKTIGTPTNGISYKMQRYTSLTSDTINFAEYFKSILDYDPYTRIKIFLPYSGTYELNIADFMAGNIKVYCMVDMLTGDMVYTIQCNTNQSEPAKTLYHFSGNCKASIPLTSSDYSRLFENIRGGLSNTTTSIVGNISRGANLYGAVSSGISAVNTLTTAIHDYNTPNISYSNDLSCDNGWLSTQQPYFIISRPKTHVAVNYSNYVGYPSLYTASLGLLSGFTVIYSIHLDGVSATENEKAEIESLLKGGVIL